MKPFKFFKLLLMALLCGVAAMGCKTNKPPVTKFPETGPNGSGGPGGPGQGGQFKTDDGGVKPGGGDAATFDVDSMIKDPAALAAETIYFDLDSAAIRSDDQSKLEAVAAKLNSDPSSKLLIEGNCDERGTEEYNRSLGERRALAAREALATRGVDPARIATRSFGEDRPEANGHDEASWRKNRRDVFVLLHPK